MHELAPSKVHLGMWYHCHGPSPLEWSYYYWVVALSLHSCETGTVGDGVAMSATDHGGPPPLSILVLAIAEAVVMAEASSSVAWWVQYAMRWTSPPYR